MKTLKITVADEDGLVLGQYVVHDERELDGMDDEARDKLEYSEPGAFYLNTERRKAFDFTPVDLGSLPDDLRIFLNRVNGD